MISLRKCLNLNNKGVVSIVGAGGKTTLMFKIAAELGKAGNSVLTTTTTKIMVPGRAQSSHLIVSENLDRIIRETKTFFRKTNHITAASGYSDRDRRKLKGFAPEIIDMLWNSKLFRWILVEADGAARKPLKVPASHEPVIPSSSNRVIGVVGLDAVGNRLGKETVFRHVLFSQITGLNPGERITETSVAAAVMNANGIFKGHPAGADLYLFLNKADNVDRVRTGRRICEIVERKNGKRFIKRIIIGKALHGQPIVGYDRIKIK